MKILYCGPYKENNFFGICARNILETLATSGCESHAFNVHLNNPYHNKTLIELSNVNKPSILSDMNYDYIIQHAPIRMLRNYHRLRGKNIAFPILDYSFDHKELQILKGFDTVIVDDDTISANLKESGIETTDIDYRFGKLSIDYRINFEHHLANKKIYYIGDLRNNQNTINKLIISFITASRSYQNISLVLMLTDENTTESEKHIKNIIGDVLKKLQYKSKLSPIKYICMRPSIEDLHLIHQDCDLYINVHDSYDSGINSSLARLYDKSILDTSNLETIIVPSIEYDSDMTDSPSKRSVLTSSMISGIKEYCEKNTVKYNKPNHRNILEILYANK